MHTSKLLRCICAFFISTLVISAQNREVGEKEKDFYSSLFERMNGTLDQVTIAEKVLTRQFGLSPEEIEAIRFVARDYLTRTRPLKANIQSLVSRSIDQTVSEWALIQEYRSGLRSIVAEEGTVLKAKLRSETLRRFEVVMNATGGK